jgi:hypothetical protein
MAPVENVGTMSQPCTSVVTNGAQLAASCSVMHAGQAMATASAPASGGTFSRSIMVSIAAVPPPMECPAKQPKYYSQLRKMAKQQ